MGVFRVLKDDRGGQLLLLFLTVVAIVIPLLNLLVPEGSPYHVTTYTVSLFGKYLTYALLALALDLVWGYCGILSLGHGAHDVEDLFLFLDRFDELGLALVHALQVVPPLELEFVIL